MRPGQDLVVAGYAGLAGARRIAAEWTAELSRWFSPAYIRKLQNDCSGAVKYAGAENLPGSGEMCADAEDLPGSIEMCAGIRERPAACRPDWEALGATEWEEAGEGGIYTALWNLSGAYGTGFSVDLRKVPVKQGTIEVCERFGLNPYRLLSDGCVVLVSDNGGGLVRCLEAEGTAAAVVGEVRAGIAREITYGEVRGFMERPREDEFRRLERAFAGEPRERGTAGAV